MKLNKKLTEPDSLFDLFFISFFAAGVWAVIGLLFIWYGGFI